MHTAGLNIGRLTYIPDIAVNNVLQQKYRGDVIEEGDSIPRGAEVDLVLGRGLSDDKTATPDLLGVLLESARQRITDRYLNVGAVIYDRSFENAEDSATAFVWKQRPAFNEEEEVLINMGSPVDIWVTADSTKHPSYEESSTEENEL